MQLKLIDASTKPKPRPGRLKLKPRPGRPKLNPCPGRPTKALLEVTRQNDKEKQARLEKQRRYLITLVAGAFKQDPASALLV